jgi:hypothetical protein
MTKVDYAVERGAQRLQEFADKAAARGDGVGEWLAEELANDAAFLRKLKPSLIKARARSGAPADPEPTAPSSPQLGKRPKKKRKRGRKRPAPVLVVAVALVAGALLAKVLDWRGDAGAAD